jgi:hypothetical protein
MSKLLKIIFSPIYYIYKYIYKYIVYKFSKKEFIYDNSIYICSEKYVPNARLPKGVLDHDLVRSVAYKEKDTGLYVCLNWKYEQEKDI